MALAALAAMRAFISANLCFADGTTAPAPTPTPVGAAPVGATVDEDDAAGEITLLNSEFDDDEAEANCVCHINDAERLGSDSPPSAGAENGTDGFGNRTDGFGGKTGMARVITSSESEGSEIAMGELLLAREKRPERRRLFGAVSSAAVPQGEVLGGAARSCSGGGR
jgi:hypothetical protein